jgi:hypothetical protein
VNSLVNRPIDFLSSRKVKSALLAMTSHTHSILGDTVVASLRREQSALRIGACAPTSTVDRTRATSDIGNGWTLSQGFTRVVVAVLALLQVWA